MGLTVKMTTTPKGNWADIADGFKGDFDAKMRDAHRKWVFLVLEYTQRFSRVDTGRSRAAWTPMMDKYGYDYQRSMPMGPHEDQTAVLEGKSQGTFFDQPFHTTIMNNVEYVEPMDQRFGMFGFSPNGAKLPAGIRGERTPSGKRMKLFGINAYGNRATMGIRFEEKKPLFEQFGNKVFQDFLDNSKTAFEAGGKEFAPAEIEPVKNDPPVMG